MEPIEMPAMSPWERWEEEWLARLGEEAAEVGVVEGSAEVEGAEAD